MNIKADGLGNARILDRSGTVSLHIDAWFIQGTQQDQHDGGTQAQRMKIWQCLIDAVVARKETTDQFCESQVGAWYQLVK